MKKIGRVFYFLAITSVLIILLLNQLNAQNVNFTATVSKNRVAVGEQFQLSFTINANASGFKAPDFSDFQLYSGPNQSSSMQYSNGAVTQSLTYYYILGGKKEGKYSINSAYINVNGKTYSTKPIAIEVVKGNAGGNPGTSQRNSNQNQGDYPADYESNVFLRASASRTKVYTGEQILVTYKIYTRLSIVDNGLSKAPTYNGFWSEDVPHAGQVELHSENIDGIQYQVAELKKTIVMPQKNGTLTIEPMEMDVIVRVKGKSRSNSIFDQFFGGGYQDVKLSIKSNSLKIEAMPLPEKGKPAGFNGAVGNFKLSSKINRLQLKANESLNLSYTLSGSGNLKLIDELKPELPPDMEVYDPKISDKINVSANGVNGYRTYDYLVIPRYEGEYDIPALAFSYFDPENGTYKTLQSESYHLSVSKGSASDMKISRQNSKEDIKDLGEDISFIYTKEDGDYKKNKWFFNSTLYYVVLFSIVLLSLIGFFALNHVKKSNSDNAENRSRKAGNMALQRLGKAKIILDGGQTSQYFEEVYKAVLGFLSFRLKVGYGELSKDKIQFELDMLKADSQLTTELLILLDNLEKARFAPPALQPDAAAVYRQTLDLITNLELNLKKK